MEHETRILNSQIIRPLLILPKICTNLIPHCELSNNLYIMDLTITSQNIDVIESVIYSGYCYVKFTDSYRFDENLKKNQIWIGPVRSPHIYSHDTKKFQKCFTYKQNQTNKNIKVGQHNIYIKQNILNFVTPLNDIVNDDYEQKKPSMIQLNRMQIQQISSVCNQYEENKFDCGMYQSQLPEVIKNEKESRPREKLCALEQLISLDIQSVGKERKTILFLGYDSQTGQTVQKIVINDTPYRIHNMRTLEDTIMFDETAISNFNNKKYQCDKCNQIFDSKSTLKLHKTANELVYSLPMYKKIRSEDEVKLKCEECKKTFKSEESFEIHCMKHGDPDLLCEKCHKVFSSKGTLRQHCKIHNRMYACNFCTKSFIRKNDLVSHTSKSHYRFICDYCEFTSLDHSGIEEHKIMCSVNNNAMNYNFNSAICCDFTEKHANILQRSPIEQDTIENKMIYNEGMQRADGNIVKMIVNKASKFSKKKQHKFYDKSCDVCLKSFKRMCDLKRHLIEHVIQNTVTKAPANENETLNILCGMCRVASFNKIEKYKAHLREHAKLTSYKCTFCNKSFSDSSNFSKHKKVHGSLLQI